MPEEKQCKDRVREEFTGRLQDLRVIWEAEKEGSEGEADLKRQDLDLPTLNEYGLCFDYVPAHTFQGQRRGYFRYQLSWGGPSDEFRFFVNPDLSTDRIEYWFLDWFDGAKVILRGDDETFMVELWESWFEDFAQEAITKAEE